MTHNLPVLNPNCISVIIPSLPKYSVSPLFLDEYCKPMHLITQQCIVLFYLKLSTKIHLDLGHHCGLIGKASIC